MSTQSLTFEETLPFFSIKGGATFTTHDWPPKGPDTTIRTDRSWHCHFHWDTDGGLNYIMGGKWKVKVLLEKWGGGENYSAKEQVLTFVSAPHHYHGTITFGPNEIPAGVYKPVVVITMEGLSGVPGPIAAFGEGKMMQFYDVGPGL